LSLLTALLISSFWKFVLVPVPGIEALGHKKGKEEERNKIALFYVTEATDWNINR